LNTSSSAPPTISPIRLVVAITGASGAILGIRLLEILQHLKPTVHTEIHLIVSPSAWLTIQQEVELDRVQIENLADVVHSPKAIGATIASGSFLHHGMIIAPCSMKTLSAIAHGYSDNLITRAADVTLKERRRLILIPRETPLNLVHLRNMTTITEMGGIIFPPVPAYYQQPKSLDDITNHMVGHVLNLLNINTNLTPSWQGL
jgi:flavin prenyltransferase